MHLYVQEAFALQHIEEVCHIQVFAHRYSCPLVPLLLVGLNVIVKLLDECLVPELTDSHFTEFFGLSSLSEQPQELGRSKWIVIWLFNYPLLDWWLFLCPCRHLSLRRLFLLLRIWIIYFLVLLLWLQKA